MWKFCKISLQTPVFSVSSRPHFQCLIATAHVLFLKCQILFTLVYSSPLRSNHFLIHLPILCKKRRIKRYLHYILLARTKETKPIQRNWWMNFFPFYLLLIRYFWKLYFLLLTFLFLFAKQKHFRIELLLFFHFLLLTSRCLSIKSYIRHGLYFNLVLLSFPHTVDRRKSSVY